MSERIARLTFEELAPKVQTVLKARVERLGYLGEFFRCAGHQPDVLAPFMEMTEALKAALPARLTEVGALTIACLMDNAYERHQHEKLSVKLGFGADWVAQVERLDPDNASLMSDADRAVQRLAIAATANGGKGVAGQFEALIDHVGPDEAIATLFLVGRYITHAIVVNTLQLVPPVPSIFAQEPCR